MNHVKRISGILVFTACLFYLWKTIGSVKIDIRAVIADANAPSVVLSVCLMFFSYLTEAYSWKTTVGFLGRDIRMKDAVSVFYLANLYNYLPLKGVSLMSRILLCGKYGIGKGTAVTSLFYETCFTLVASLAVTMVVVGYRYGGSLLPGILVFSSGALLLFFTGYQFIRKAAGWYGRITGRHLHLDKKTDLTTYSVLISPYVVSRVLSGAAFSLLMYAFSSPPAVYFPFLAAVPCAVWMLSLAGIVIPRGIGVREAAYVYILSIYFPAAAVLTPVVVLRLMTLLMDVLFGAYGKVRYSAR